MMGVRLLVLVGVVSLFGSACAQGSALTNGDGGDGGSGAGAGAGDPGGTGAGTTTSATGTGGGGPTCSESPCKLVEPQCGCGADEACDVVSQDGTRQCVAAGTKAQGEVCGGTECGAGLVCLNTAPPLSTCAKYCSADADCEAPGGLCVYKLDNGMGGDIPGVALCTDNCDPASPSCAQGTACQLGQEQTGQQRVFSMCTSTGQGTHTSPCADSGDCAPTFGCIGELNNEPVCLQWCKVGVTACPNGLTCSSFTPAITLGSVEYGACL